MQPGDDFASRIRLLTKQSAINLGMSGNGPLIELASLKEYTLKKHNLNLSGPMYKWFPEIRNKSNWMTIIDE